MWNVHAAWGQGCEGEAWPQTPGQPWPPLAWAFSLRTFILAPHVPAHRVARRALGMLCVKWVFPLGMALK